MITVVAVTAAADQYLHAVSDEWFLVFQVYTSVLQNLPRRNGHNGKIPPVLEAGVGKYIVLLTPLAVGAGAVAYAKWVCVTDYGAKYYRYNNWHVNFRENKAFRQQLVDNIPGIEPVLKVLLQEDGNAFQEASKSINNATQKVVGVKDTVTGFFGGSKEEEKPAPSKREWTSPGYFRFFLNIIMFVL